MLGFAVMNVFTSFKVSKPLLSILTQDILVFCVVCELWVQLWVAGEKQLLERRLSLNTAAAQLPNIILNVSVNYQIVTELSILQRTATCPGVGGWLGAYLNGQDFMD